MTVDLAAGEQRRVNFTTTRYAPGSFMIDVNGATSSLVVCAPAPQASNGLPLGMVIGVLLSWGYSVKPPDLYRLLGYYF